MPTIDLMNRIAATDATFTRQGGSWVGRCLICNGPLGFDATTGAGANVEHIVPRSLGGSSDLLNLGITHPRCNGEKGRRWDPKRHHRSGTDRSERYQALVERLLAERQARWRNLEDADGADDGRRISEIAANRARNTAHGDDIQRRPMARKQAGQ